jgi:hypothetical protein
LYVEGRAGEDVDVEGCAGDEMEGRAGEEEEEEGSAGEEVEGTEEEEEGTFMLLRSLKK